MLSVVGSKPTKLADQRLQNVEASTPFSIGERIHRTPERRASTLVGVFLAQSLSQLLCLFT